MLKKVNENNKFSFTSASDYIHSTCGKYPWFERVKSFTLHYGGGLYDRVDRHHVFLLGSGLAFSLFVCIVPFVLIIFSIAGSLLDSAKMQYQITALIDAIIPYHRYSAFVKRIIFTRINEVIQYKTIAGIVGGFGLLFAASGLFSSMRTILNTVFNVENDIHYLLGKLKDFALVFMVILLFFATTILMPVIDVLRQAADHYEILAVFKSGIFEHIAFSILSFLVILFLFLVLYFTVPVVKLPKKAVIVSALWAAILWEAAKQVFGYYIYNFGTLGQIYGTYALIVVVAFWIYYSSVVFIIGAEIGQLYTERLKNRLL
jgi:membrane protein